jgi:hypothetical protein
MYALHSLEDPEVAYELNRMKSPRVIRPVLFTLALGVGSFGAAHYLRLNRASVETRWKNFKTNWMPSWLDWSSATHHVQIPVLGPDGRTSPPSQLVLRHYFSM